MAKSLRDIYDAPQNPDVQCYALFDTIRVSANSAPPCEPGPAASFIIPHQNQKAPHYLSALEGVLLGVLAATAGQGSSLE